MFQAFSRKVCTSIDFLSKPLLKSTEFLVVALKTWSTSDHPQEISLTLGIGSKSLLTVCGYGEEVLCNNAEEFLFVCDFDLLASDTAAAWGARVKRDICADMKFEAKMYFSVLVLRRHDDWMKKREVYRHPNLEDPSTHKHRYGGVCPAKICKCSVCWPNLTFNYCMTERFFALF